MMTMMIHRDPMTRLLAWMALLLFSILSIMSDTTTAFTVGTIPHHRSPTHFQPTMGVSTSYARTTTSSSHSSSALAVTLTTTETDIASVTLTLGASILATMALASWGRKQEDNPEDRPAWLKKAVEQVDGIVESALEGKEQKTSSTISKSVEISAVVVTQPSTTATAPSSPTTSTTIANPTSASSNVSSGISTATVNASSGKTDDSTMEQTTPAATTSSANQSTKRSKRRWIVKAAKKVVMPWKKWSTL